MGMSSFTREVASMVFLLALSLTLINSTVGPTVTVIDVNEVHVPHVCNLVSHQSARAAPLSKYILCILIKLIIVSVSILLL